MTALHLGLIGPAPPPSGGMAMQTEQLARLLRAEGLQVTQVVSNAPYSPAWVERLPGLRALHRLFFYVFAVWRLAGRVDAIHLMANSGWSWQLFAAPVLWLAPLRDCPVIVNYRGGEADSYFRRAWRRVRPSLNRAALVVVPSGFLRAVFAEYGQSTRIIPNIVDLSVFRPVQDTTGPARPFTLVITRNLEPIYGIETALEALAKVLQSAPETRLRIAGSGPQESELRILASTLDISHAVEFTGRLDRRGIAQLYAEADAMLNPTTVDNMPNSLIEALASGLPVISTAVGGVPYIVRDGDTALLVPVHDATAMAAAILRLQDDESIREYLRRQGLAEVAQYAWPAVREQWLAAYDEVACRKSGTLV